MRSTILVAVLLTLTGCESSKPETPPLPTGQTQASTFEQGIKKFKKLYVEKWTTDAEVTESVDGDLQILSVSSASVLRPEEGNHPKIYHHGKKTDHVIVLIHGITDSPYYMQEIGREFHQLGFNVVLPLLPAHGLQNPGPAFRDPDFSYKSWTDDVDRVLEAAAGLGETVSLGGFSTGGALTVEKVIRSPEQITGGLYLFAAALDIGKTNQFILQLESGRMIGRLKDDKQWLGLGDDEKLTKLLEDQAKGASEDSFGIGTNPYKYSVFFYEGASQLAQLIATINEQYENEHDKFSDISQPVFVAHSKVDEAAMFAGGKLFFENHPNDNKVNIWFEKEKRLAHADLVLRTPIPGVTIDQSEQEDAESKGVTKRGFNPDFDEMMDSLIAFTKTHVISEDE